MSVTLTPGAHNWAFWMRGLQDHVLVSLVMRLAGLGPRAFCRTFGVMDDRNLRRVLQPNSHALKPRARAWFRCELLHRVQQWERLGYSTDTVWGLMERLMQNPQDLRG